MLWALLANFEMQASIWWHAFDAAFSPPQSWPFVTLDAQQCLAGAPNTLIFFVWKQSQPAVKPSHCFKRPVVVCFECHGRTRAEARSPPARYSLEHSTLQLSAPPHTNILTKYPSPLLPHPTHFSAAFTWDTERRRDWVVNDGAARCPETASETNEWLVRHYIDHECLLVSHCNKEKGQMVYLLIWGDKMNCLLLIYERIIILKITSTFSPLTDPIMLEACKLRI